MRALTLVAAVGLSLSLRVPAVAQSQQRFADLGTCPTSGGEVVRECRVGYRTFGRLNERRDNAVLVPTWHGGRSETMVMGSSLGGVIKEVEYVTDLSHYRDIARVRKEFFPDNFPAATLVEVKGLFKKDQVFEIDVVALLD